MAERQLPPFQRTDILQKIGTQLQPVINKAELVLSGSESMDLKSENFSPALIRIAHQIISEGDNNTGQEDVSKNKRLIASLKVGKFLVEPRTIKDFQDLKYAMLSCRYELDPITLEQVGSYGYRALHFAGGLNSGDKITKEKIETLNILFKMSDQLKIVQSTRIDSEYRMGVVSAEQMWRRIEESAIEDSQRCVVHSNLDSLTERLNILRQKDYRKVYVPRIGLIFGDFRVGFHPGHSELAAHAKQALGRDGKLLVVTPTTEVIQKVNKKGPVWPDDIRLALIANDRSVNDVLISDMPHAYWSHPGDHWGNVWRAIDPDLVFLGESNHPLEPAYRYQSEQLGGILLIDDSIRSGVRSGSLLEM